MTGYRKTDRAVQVTDPAVHMSCMIQIPKSEKWSRKDGNVTIPHGRCFAAFSRKEAQALKFKATKMN